MKSDHKYTTISVPIQLNEKLKQKIEGTGFNSVSSYVTYILRQLISSTETGSKGFTHEDERKIQQRLKNLDYL